VSEIVPADFSKLVPVKPAPHYKYERDGVYSQVLFAGVLDACSQQCSLTISIQVVKQ